MSVEAISWALNLAPVPADRGRQPSSACKFVLVGLANHAGPDGTGAFPSVATLVRYTGLSERTVSTCLDRLEAEKIIRLCDPDVVAARIKRADRRPQGWDLYLALGRGDLDAAAAAALEHQFPGLASGSPLVRSRALTAALAGCDHRTPLPPAARLWITGLTGCSGCTRRRERGAAGTPTVCSRCRNGVQRLHPNLQTTIEGTIRCLRARARGAAGAAGGGGPVSEFFAALGDACRLTAAQRARLAPLP